MMGMYAWADKYVVEVTASDESGFMGPKLWFVEQKLIEGKDYGIAGMMNTFNQCSRSYWFKDRNIAVQFYLRFGNSA